MRPGIGATFRKETGTIQYSYANGHTRRYGVNDSMYHVSLADRRYKPGHSVPARVQWRVPGTAAPDTLRGLGHINSGCAEQTGLRLLGL